MGLPNNHDIAFTIDIADFSKDHFRVIDFQLEERLSELFVLTATVACIIDPKLQPAAMIDKTSLQAPDIKNFFHAFVIDRHLDKALNNFVA